MTTVTITKKNIPAYLMHSYFFRALNDDDSDPFDVPSSCFKTNTSVKCHDDLVHLVMTLQFWGLDVIPSEVISYVLDHGCAEVTRLVSVLSTDPKFEKFLELLWSAAGATGAFVTPK